MKAADELNKFFLEMGRCQQSSLTYEKHVVGGCRMEKHRKLDEPNWKVRFYDASGQRIMAQKLLDAFNK